VIAIIILAQSISIIFPMKATWYDQQGKAPEVIQYGDLPTPETAADEVLMQVHALAVNPSDTKKRRYRTRNSKFTSYNSRHND
jgi:NADPH:quinone reductase-like Zn-dependent oxidoreductase